MPRPAEHQREVTGQRPPYGYQLFTFVHLAEVTRPETDFINALPSFKAFQAELKERCVEPPLLSELNALESYRI